MDIQWRINLFHQEPAVKLVTEKPLLGENKDFDVAIIGSGIVGSILGAILAKNGLKVVIFEKEKHPRFSISESLIIEASEVLRTMAVLYDIPEIAYFSSENYFPKIGTAHGVKRHFSFVHHTENMPCSNHTVLQAIIPEQPYGHELHIYRQDSDYYFATVAIKYGAVLHQETGIIDFSIDSNGVRLLTDTQETYKAKYIVDSGGFRSIIAEKYKLRSNDLRTFSRTIFTHMIQVPSFHSVSFSKDKFGIPYSFSEGTLHHVFKGGWLWVIPFNNHKMSTNPFCSVGLVLDPRIYPIDNHLSPEEEFFKIVGKFPSIKAQFQNSQSIRKWVRTNRIQYTSKEIIGDRYCLLGHAAGFIDPLYSKGLYISLSCLNMLAHQLIEAHGNRDWSSSQFEGLSNMTKRYIKVADQLVEHSYISFFNYKLWSVYAVLWLVGAYLEGLKLATSRILFSKDCSREKYFDRIQNLSLSGAGYEEYEILSGQVQKILKLVNSDNENAVNQAVTDIIRLYDKCAWIPFVMKEIARGKNHLPRAKFRLRLFFKKGGLMGTWNYRKYFYEELSWFDLGLFLFKEKRKYSYKNIKKNTNYSI